MFWRKPAPEPAPEAVVPLKWRTDYEIRPAVIPEEETRGDH